MSDYLTNAWYVAGWSDEISPGSMLARTLLDVPVLLIRNPAGQVGALLDRCPHRFAPLSLGKITAVGVQCGYHGLGFNVKGQCVSNPHGPVTKKLRVPNFTVHEAHQALWIWMGKEPANLALLPDLAFIDEAPTNSFSKGYLYSRGNYQLYTDNIMDLSHVDYLHPNSIGSGAITRTRAQISEQDLGISISWIATNEALGPLMEKTLQLKGAGADVWTEVHWSAPSVMRLVHGGVRSGRPREEGVNHVNLHAVTPETRSSTHYFFASTRNYQLDDSAFNEQLAYARKHIFSTEDKPMIEAQHDRMNGADFWDLKPMLFGVDRGVVRVRRKLEELIAQENGLVLSAASQS